MAVLRVTGLLLLLAMLPTGCTKKSSGGSTATTATLGAGTEESSDRVLDVAAALSISIDANGVVYVFGSSTVGDTAETHAYLRKSEDGGELWFPTDLGADLLIESSLATADGALYVAGSGYSDTATAWLVKKSTDSGGTWSVADAFLDEGASLSKALGISVDSAGGLSVAGLSKATAGQSTWVVRRSENSGASWDTMEDFLYSEEGALSHAYGIASTDLGRSYAVGVAADSSGTYRWVTRQTFDDGASWDASDDFLLAEGKDAGAQAVAVTSDLTIFVAGYALDAENRTTWIVRRSSDAGATWETVDSFLADDQYNSYASAIAISSEGVIYVAGAAAHSDPSAQRWMVRKSSDGGETWVTVSDYLPEIALFYTHGIAVGPQGEIYVVGNKLLSSGLTLWLTRKSADEGETWETVDEYTPDSYAALRTRPYHIPSSSSPSGSSK